MLLGNTAQLFPRKNVIHDDEFPNNTKNTYYLFRWYDMYLIKPTGKIRQLSRFTIIRWMGNMTTNSEP